jgi:UDP-glucuronate decarboxylase
MQRLKLGQRRSSSASRNPSNAIRSEEGVETAEEVAQDFRGVFAGKDVLVTGGAGFLGSWLCETLVASGASVACLDNFSTGQSQNLFGFKRKIRTIRANVSTARLGTDYDYIFHMSSRASPEEYQQFPIETLMANSAGTMRMLELARKSDATIVYASTSEIYGDAAVVPTPESYYGYVSSVGIRSCYDEAKRFGEAACMAYWRQHGVHVRIPRIFNTYGPRIRSDGAYARVVPRFVLQALNDEPITIHGNGTQTRSFCYVTDTVRGLMLLASSRGIDGETFNIGNPDEITVVSLAEKIIEFCSSASGIRYVDAREDDPRRRCPDLTKAGRLGWRPRTGLEEGLTSTIAYFREARHS